MKTKVFGAALAAALLFPLIVSSQKLKYSEQELSISKTAKKKGMYITTTMNDNSHLRTFISYDLKKDKMGFDVITADLDGNIVENVSEEFGDNSEDKYHIEVPRSAEISYPNNTRSAVRLVTAQGILGSMKFERGHFEPSYATSVEYGPYITTYTSVFRGFKFVDDETVKSGTKINILATHVPEEDNIERNYTIVQGVFKSIGTVGFVSENAQVSFVGKDARFDKDSPNASNVLVAGMFDAPTKAFNNLNDVVLDYNFIGVANGYASNGDRAVLLSTLNAPTSVSAHKKWQADGEPYMTYIAFDLDGNVNENITFKSTSVRGNFGLVGYDGAAYVMGSINEGHDGYYRADVGKATHFQVIKLKNGQEEARSLVSYDDLEKSMIVPHGEKGKLKVKDLRFMDWEEAPNGEILVFAMSGSNYMLFQIGTDAQVKAFYLIERVPLKELYSIGLQTKTVDDEVYVLFREQNGAISQGMKKSVSRGAGYMKNVNFSRVDELMSYGRVVKINPQDKTCSSPIDIDDEVILGDAPMFVGSTGNLLLPVRNNKKRTYKIVSIQ